VTFSYFFQNYAAIIGALAMLPIVLYKSCELVKKYRNKKPCVKYSGNVIDFSVTSKGNNRYYGHNFSLQDKRDEEGRFWQIAVWLETAPEVGDLMKLGIEMNKCAIYKILEVDACGNPSDMYFVEAEWVPKHLLVGW
jgi:hypothetical protein